MASSSSHRSFLPLSAFMLLFSMVVDSGSAQNTIPAPIATTEKYQKWCQVASDSPSCVRVIESIPGIQEVEYNNAVKVAELCVHFGAKKTAEAKEAADALLAAANGKPSDCLKACANNIKSMAEVLVDFPVGKDGLDDVNTYRTFKAVRAQFKNENPPACEKDCWNRWLSSPNDGALADKFHDIWNVARVGNNQINIIFPWPDSEDDRNTL